MTSRITSRMKVCLGFLLSIIIGVNGDCGNPERLSYAELVDPSQSSVIFKDGESVQYKCLPGYTRVSPTISTSVTCSGSAWASPATPFCELRKCPSPGETPNGEVHIDTVTFGSTVTYTCNEGYRFLSKVTTRECRADGTWSGVVPVCEAVVCQPPKQIVDGNYEPVKDEYEYSNGVTFTCNKDLALVGDASLSCTSMGNWSHPEPQCKEVSCTNPDIPNSKRLSGFKGPYGLNSAITLECESGFSLIGSSSISCDHNSQWSPSVPRCEIVCAAPIVQNADVSEGLNGPYTQDSTVTFVCHNKYVMSGSNTVRCSANGQWEPSLPKCLLPCPDPKVENAEKSPSGPYNLDSTVTIKCLPNFILHGSATTKCNVNGQWGPLPECRKKEDEGAKVQCPDPKVENAEKSPSGPYNSDSTLTIKCLQNFTLHGSATTKCNVNGQWGPLPECRKGGGSNVGAIVGGIVGAIVLIVAIIVGILFYKRKQGKSKASDFNAHYKSCSP